MSSNAKNGFSLVELMVALLIASILIGTGVPAFNWLIQKNRTASQINALISSINFARSEALKRSEPVILASTGNGNNWSAGWRVYQDANGNGGYDAGEELRVIDALPASSNLLTTRSAITVNKDGFLSGMNSGGSVVWSLSQSNCSGDVNRSLTLYQSGRNLIQKITCS